MRGIGDDTRRGERQAMPLRHPRRDMRFHVDGDGAGRAVKRRLLRRLRHDGVRAEQRVPGRLGQASGEPARPRGSVGIGTPSASTASATTQSAGRNPGASPPAMPMLMMPLAPAASRSSTASRRAVIAAAGDGLDIRAGDDAPFPLQAGGGEDHHMPWTTRRSLLRRRLR